MRRSLFGYRPADVAKALAELESASGRAAETARAQLARAEGLQRALEETREACTLRDRRMALLEAELELARSRSASQVRGLSLLGAELEELRVSARGQATRIRLAALREAAELNAGSRAMAAEGDSRRWDELLAALLRAVERVGSEWEDDEDRPEPAPSGERPAAPAARRAGNCNEPAAGRISVDVGPFRDFSQLVSFEDAANAIGATGEISIRRFSAGRASIDVDLDEPIDLLRALEESCDLNFEVRERSDEEIVLDLGD